MTRMSRRLVVDASVTSCASGKDDPLASDCRAFLEEMLNVCHKVVVTAEIQREWQDHFSNFSLLWLAAMRVKRKVVIFEPAGSIELQDAMVVEGFSETEEAAALKDVLLVEAALGMDKAIVSRDERARRLYIRLAGHVRALRSVVWVNPVREEDRPIDWLRSGARLERERRLGSAHSANP